MGFDADVQRRQSLRLRGYDYAAVGAYFVTVCTQGRECLFGAVTDGDMSCNASGDMVKAVWGNLPERFSHLVPDTFVVMPNHLHGIVWLTETLDQQHDTGRGEPRVRPPCLVDSENPGDHKDRPYGTAPGSLGRIVQAFKSLTTSAYIRGVDQHGWPPFIGRLWQRNYYEHIIRSESELAAVRNYIAANPLNWQLDPDRPTPL